MSDSLKNICEEFTYDAHAFFIDDIAGEIHITSEPKFLEDIRLRFRVHNYLYDTGVSNGITMKMKFLRAIDEKKK